jgi:ankyrin repeat protein
VSDHCRMIFSRRIQERAAAALLIRLLLPTIILALWSGATWADWSLAGAQYKCDERANTFVLLPYDRSSDDPPDGSPPKPGYHEIAAASVPIVCKVGAHEIHADIAVFPPVNGMCMGGGTVGIRDISAHGVNLVPGVYQFNWQCPAEQVALTKILITAVANRLRVERCFTSTLPSEPPAAAKCKSEDIDIEALIAAKATYEHDLADVATQTALSATRLPRTSDFATIFLSGDRSRDVLPTCAHLRSNFQFLAGMVGEVRALPRGRIAGSKGDRVYIHQGHPQLCDRNSELLCRPRAYVIPGDGVDVGFICGDWAFVRYTANGTTARSVEGWVATDKLYAVERVGPADASKLLGKWDRWKAEPLIKAVIANDMRRLTSVIAAGADPNGPNETGIALDLAVATRRAPIVKALLAAGADPMTHGRGLACSETVDIALFTSQEVFDMLVKAGMNPSCKKDALHTVARDDRVDVALYELWVWGRWTPASDLPALATRLIEFGVPVDAALPSGKTALIATIEANNVDVARTLLRAGANPNVAMHADGTGDTDTGSTALLMAVVAYRNHLDPTMIRVLLEGGANPNYRTEGSYHIDVEDLGESRPYEGVTALHVAAEGGLALLTQTLLEHGADPAIPRQDGALAVNIARQNGHPDVAMLIERYARKQ